MNYGLASAAGTQAPEPQSYAETFLNILADCQVHATVALSALDRAIGGGPTENALHPVPAGLLERTQHELIGLREMLEQIASRTQHIA